MGAEERDRAPRAHFSDPDVCKLALCGLSPLELLQGTRSAPDVYRVLGPDYRQRPPDAAEREAWAALDQRQRDAYGYEYELRRVLERLVVECDRRVARGRERVARETRERPWGPEEIEKREDLRRREREALELAQALGEAGDVDGAQEAVLQAEGVQQLLRDLEKKHRPEAKVEVCEISGILLSPLENSEARRFDKEGRQYVGWKRIREVLEELRKRDPPPASRPNDGRGGGYSRVREREHRGARGASRGGGGERHTRDPGTRDAPRRDDWRRDGGDSASRRW